MGPATLFRCVSRAASEPTVVICAVAVVSLTMAMTAVLMTL